MGKYRFWFLNHPDEDPYISTSGITSYYRNTPDSYFLGSECYNINVGDTIDIPAGVFNNRIFIACLKNGKTDIVINYKRSSFAYSSAAKSFRNGMHRALQIYKRKSHSKVFAGALTQINPVTKTGNTRVEKAEDTFYVGDQLVLDASFNLLIGTFLRVSRVSERNYNIEKCIVKVSPKVFIDPSTTLNKIILKEILPDIAGQSYMCTPAIWLTDEDPAIINTRVVLNTAPREFTAVPTSIECGTDTKVFNSVPALDYGHDDAKISKDAAKYIDNIRTLDDIL